MNTQARRPLVPEDRNRRRPDAFVKAAFELAQSKALKREPRFAADDPVPGMILRADQTIGTTGTAGWAAELARTSWRDYLVSLAPFSAGGRLVELAVPAVLAQDNILNYPTVAAGPGTLAWCAEGDPIAVNSVSFSTTVLGPPRKLAGILVWSAELAKRSDATTIFQALLRESIAGSIDSAFLSATAASAAAHAGLLASVVALAAYPGSDAAAVEADLVALSNACAASGGSGRTTFIMSADRWARLRLIAPILAGSIDAVPSNAVPANRIIGIDGPSLVIAVDQVPEIVTTNVGTVHLSDVPLPVVNAAGVVGDPIREVWQTGAIAVRTLHWLAFAKRRATCVNFIDGATW